MVVDVSVFKKSVVKIIGGLGNQMFQYAFAYSVSQKTNTPIKIDISAFEFDDLRQYALDIYCIVAEIATENEVNRLKYQPESLVAKFMRKLTKQSKPPAKTYYKEPFFQFDKGAFTQSGNVYFDGYWQSEKYFLDYREDLLKQFTLKAPIHTKSEHYQQQILAKESISLHIRRGDYVSNVYTNSVHGTCSLDYYQQAVTLLESKLNNPHFFIFSDDLAWAKEHLSFIENVTFVELDVNIPDHDEMFLMSQCLHHIIANSSFSWWGAWLNKNLDKIVIAPKRWFIDETYNTSDLIPDAWIRL